MVEISKVIVNNILSILSDEPMRPAHIIKLYSKKFKKGINTKQFKYKNLDTMLKFVPGVQMVIMDGEENFVHRQKYKKYLKLKPMLEKNAQAKEATKTKQSVKVSKRSEQTEKAAKEKKTNVQKDTKVGVHSKIGFSGKPNGTKPTKENKKEIKVKEIKEKPFYSLLDKYRISSPTKDKIQSQKIDIKNIIKQTGNRISRAKEHSSTSSRRKETSSSRSIREKKLGDIDELIFKAAKMVVLEVKMERRALENRIETLKSLVSSTNAAIARLEQNTLVFCQGVACFHLVSCVLTPCGHLYCSECSKRLENICFLCGSGFLRKQQLHFF